MDFDDPFDHENGFYDEPRRYTKNDFAEIDEPYFLQQDYGFQMRMDENMEVFMPKAFFSFEPFNINEKIKKVTISEDIFMIISETNRIFRWEIEPNKVSELTITRSGGDVSGTLSRELIVMVRDNVTVDKKGSTVIERIFLDQRGTHCLLCTPRGENYYIHKKSNKVRLLKNFKERIRCAIIDDQSTNELAKVLCGTFDGKIYYFTIESNKLFEINDTPARAVISNLQSPVLLEPTKETIYRAVLVLTAQYLYFFTGNRDFYSLFDNYTNKDPATNLLSFKFTGLPINTNKKSPLVNFYTVRSSNNLVLGSSLIVSDGNYIHYCKLPEKVERLDFNPFMKLQTVKYARREAVQNAKDQLKIVDLPLAIACSTHHYFILHRDCLTILSTINESVVACYEGKDLSETSKVLGLVGERGGENIYIFDSASVRTISLSREGQDVWKFYLDKKRYQEAYDICKRNMSPSLKYVTGLYADYLFSIGKYDMAAEKYTETSRSFEEICLKYITKNVLGYLEKYLQYWLRHPSVKKSEMRQTILMSWILEYKLHVLNEREREIEISDKPENEKIRDMRNVQRDFSDFLFRYQNELDKEITYSLLQSHGRFKEFVEFAEFKQKYEDIILHHVNEEEYDLALNNMKKLPENEQRLEQAYKHCHILMKELTEDMLDYLRKNVTDLELPRLIPGFTNVPPEKRYLVVDFLRYFCAQTKICKEKSIHNIYIVFLSHLREETLLDEYLTKQEELLLTEENGTIQYDVDFALGNFEKNGLVRARIKVYGMMGLFIDAVTLALKHNRIEEAKELALKPEGTTPEIEDLRKKLWMMVILLTLHLIKSKQIEAVIRLTKESNNIIRIEDLLPHFDDNFKIELFKDDISVSLKTYVENIKKLKSDIAAFEKNEEQLKAEVKSLKHRYVEIKPDQTCEECGRSIYVEEFYGFPCTHCFHSRCLKKKLKKLNIHPEEYLREIETLDAKLSNLLSDSTGVDISRKPSMSFLESFSMSKSKRESVVDSRRESIVNPMTEKEIKKIRERLDFLLAKECLACGKYLIDTITIGFESDAKARRDWEI